MQRRPVGYVTWSTASSPARCAGSPIVSSTAFSCRQRRTTATPTPSLLLEILDPQRFTRGVPVRPRELDAVMVRRLKSDLRHFGEKFPVVVRKATLTSVLAKARAGIRYNEHLEFDDGEAVFNHACRMGGRDRQQAEGLDLSLRPLAGLAQDEESGMRGCTA